MISESNARTLLDTFKDYVIDKDLPTAIDGRASYLAALGQVHSCKRDHYSLLVMLHQPRWQTFKHNVPIQNKNLSWGTSFTYAPKMRSVLFTKMKG